MKQHTKIYFDFFEYAEDDIILCEICNQRVVDIHHIHSRGRGGSKDKNYIENLVALCRSCHNQYGDKKQYIDMLTEKHLTTIRNKQEGYLPPSS